MRRKTSKFGLLLATVDFFSDRWRGDGTLIHHGQNDSSLLKWFTEMSDFKLYNKQNNNQSIISR